MVLAGCSRDKGKRERDIFITIMTSKRAAKSLTNCYILVSEFDWNSRCIDACGVIVEIPIDIRPYREVWHYLGIVLSEVKWVKLQEDSTVE